MSDNNYSLINFDGASDVVIKLLDMIQNAVGWCVIPKRKAADFEKGLSVYVESIENDPTLSGLEKGVKISSARKEMKQYINQGKIIAYAAKDIQVDSKLDVDDDWLMYFFEYAKNVSADDVQRIWAKILAERCNGNTSMNRRLINALSMLDHETAHIFERLCGITLEFTCYYIKYAPLVFPVCIYKDYLSELEQVDQGKVIEFTKYHLNFVGFDEKNYDFKKLKDNGLIEMRTEENTMENVLNIEPEIMLNGKAYKIKGDKGIKNLELGRIKYTELGESLCDIVNTSYVFPYFDILMERYFKSQGYILLEK